MYYNEVYNQGITTHKTEEEALNATTKEGIIAVKITTYIGDRKEVEFKTFKCGVESPTNEELTELYPYSLGSNQSIEEL